MGYMWDAKHGMHLIRQPSHSGGTQSVPFPSFFFVFVFCFFFGYRRAPSPTDDCSSRSVSQVCLKGLSQRRHIMEGRYSCRLFASSLEIGLARGASKPPEAQFDRFRVGLVQCRAAARPPTPRATLRDPNSGPGFWNRQWLLGIGCATGPHGTQRRCRVGHVLGDSWVAVKSPTRSRAGQQIWLLTATIGAWHGELARYPAGMSSAAAAFVCFLDPAESDLVRL